jgi:hypothetical protein
MFWVDWQSWVSLRNAGEVGLRFASRDAVGQRGAGKDRPGEARSSRGIAGVARFGGAWCVEVSQRRPRKARVGLRVMAQTATQATLV